MAGPQHALTLRSKVTELCSLMPVWVCMSIELPRLTVITYFLTLPLGN